MFKGVSGGLCIKRIGVFADGAVLACARGENTKKTDLFIIRGDENKGYFRTGSNRQWQRLNKHSTEIALQSICQAVTQGLEVFDINGKSDNIINRNALKGGNMFTKAARFTAAMVLAVVMTTVSMPIGIAHAESLHWGQRQHKNIIPASPVYTGVVAGNGQNHDELIVSGGASNTGIVAGGSVYTGIVSGAKHIAATIARNAVPPNTDTEAAVVADETGSDLPDSVRVKITDAHGNFIGWRFENIERDDAGRIIKRNIVTYDKDGKKVGIRTLSYDYTVDENNKAVSATVTCKKNGEVIWTAEHAYTRDENGRITERQTTFKDADGNIIRTAVQTHARDENGRITESSIERKNANGKTISRDTISITYDDNGNITKKTVTRTNAAGNKKSESVTTYKNGVAQNTIKKFFTNDGKVYRKEIARYS